MSDGVFGDLIDEAKLRKLFAEYRDKKVITRADMAKVARDWQDDRHKNIDCANYVNNLQKSYDNGLSTRCMIYNATGSDLNLLASRDWQGRLYSNPYPITIRNGQWGGWLHVKTSQSCGSAGAVAYRGKNNKGTVKDWLQSWEVPMDQTNYVNKVYTEGREEGHFKSKDNWDFIRYYLTRGNDTDEMDGCIARASIGSGITPDYIGIMTITDSC